MNALNRIAQRFDIAGGVRDIHPLGEGLINDTYKVNMADGSAYVLQRINNAIFRDVDLLQRNIEAVTAHIRGKLEKSGTADIGRKVLQFIKVKGSDKTYLLDDGRYWRLSAFISDSYTYDTVSPEYARFAGEAFGNFESMLSDIPAEIGEPIPDFHNMELRLHQLEEAVDADKAGRMKDEEVRSILAEIRKHAYDMCEAERLYAAGLLPKRICHCDTKVNNILFDKDKNVLCVIDLDTVMPGFVFSDFGDFLRTAGSSLPEDDPDAAGVKFRMDIFESFAEGYLKSTASFLTPVEREHLPYGALRFAYMQAVRFFADYLNGDTYYKINYPEHNLVRTRNQMALFHSMTEHLGQMSRTLEEIAGA